MSDENNVISPKFFMFVASMAHLLTGSTLAFGVLLFFGPHWLLYFLPAFALVTGVKEFWYDAHYENAATRGSDLLDFSCYQAGAYIGLALYLWKFHPAWPW